MNISITLGEFDFDLEIDITTYPIYTPPYASINLKTGGLEFADPGEYIGVEFDIESVDYGLENLTWRDWKIFNDEEKCFYNDLVMKANQLKHNDYSEEERSIILDRINEDLKLEAKYAMEP